jgi:hypothetical protein
LLDINCSLPALREQLIQHGYLPTAGVPAFTSPRLQPFQNRWVERRFQQGNPLPLAAHSHPSRFLAHLPEGARQLYEVLYLHQQGQLQGEAAELLEQGLARWQVTCTSRPEGDPLLVFSSIQGRSPGEFVYLGDDSGLLIEAAWEWLRGRGRGRALDLCCGCGVVGQALPGGFSEVHGLDANATAIELAQVNLELNQLGHHYQYCVSDLWSRAEGLYDFVVGNPPSLPVASHLLYAHGGPNPAALTLGCVQGLLHHLAIGGRCLLLAFSVREQLYEQICQLLPDEFSLLYQPRRRLPMTDPDLGYMEHCWIRICRDQRGRREKRPMGWHDWLCQWSLPWPPAEKPRQGCYAGNLHRSSGETRQA